MRVAISYGAFELKRAYQRNLSLAVIIAGLIHILLIVSFLFFTQIEAQKSTAKRIITIRTPLELGAPPSLTQSIIQQIAVSAPVASVPPAVGIPLAVPDEKAKEMLALATQKELGILQRPTIEIGMGSDETLVVKGPVAAEYIPAPGEFVPVEEDAVPIKLVKPNYPELARRSGVEGVVWIELLVDKNGKVTDARCLKEKSVNPDIFCETAVKAAMENEFKPAINNKVPITVRVIYPVYFNLR